MHPLTFLIPELGEPGTIAPSCLRNDGFKKSIWQLSIVISTARFELFAFQRPAQNLLKFMLLAWKIFHAQQ